MKLFACGSCKHDYDRKNAPRYISAAETAYPCSLPDTCAQCGELSTPMVICLACALENNQCQNCRTEMFGVNEKLLDEIRQLRDCFNRSVALHRAVFAAAVAPFKEELDEFLAAGAAAEKCMISDLDGLDAEKAAARYSSYLAEERERPFAYRAQYKMADEELRLCLKVDRDLFQYQVEHACARNSQRSALLFNLSRAVGARPASYDSDSPPPAVETTLATFVLSRLSDKDRQAIDDLRRRSFEVGKQIYARMKLAN